MATNTQATFSPSPKSIFSKIRHPSENEMKVNLGMMCIFGLFLAISWFIYSQMVTVQKELNKCAEDCPSDPSKSTITITTIEYLTLTIALISTLIVGWFIFYFCYWLWKKMTPKPMQ